MLFASAIDPTAQLDLDPLTLAKNSSGVVFVVLCLLVVAAVVVWFVTVLKLLQLRRWARAQARFDEDAQKAHDADTLHDVARFHTDAPGARVVTALIQRRNVPQALEGVAKRAVVDEQKRASSLMPTLASIGSSGPFVGLFGTVWGIMDAFLRIGREKSASLPVVAPAIGEALIATAIGLFAAIPAVVAYNALSKRIDDLLSAVEASATGWLAIVAGDPTRVSRGPSASPPDEWPTAQGNTPAFPPANTRRSGPPPLPGR